MMGDRKLSSEQVREIRRRYAGGNTCKILAMEYGVSTATISNYVLGVKREPADRHERVSFGGDPLPSELKGAGAANGAGKQDVSGADKLGGAADKQHGADKPGGGDTVKDGGAVPAEYAGDTVNKGMSGEDKPSSAADKQRGDKAVSSVDDKQDGNGADKPGGASDKDMSGEDKPENAAENPGSAAEKQRGSDEKLFLGDTKKVGRDTKKAGGATKKTGRATEKTGGGSVPDKAEEKEGFAFSEKLKRLFDESGKTTGDLKNFIEEKTGKKFTPEPIRNWCKGNYFPGIRNVPLIAEFFGVSTDYLLTSTEDKGVKVNDSDPDGLDACDLATGFFMFLEKNIRGDISINILRRDGVVEIKISSKDEELMFKRRVGGSEGGGA